MKADKNPLTRQGRRGRRDSPVEERTTLKRLYRILRSEVKRDGAQPRGRRRSRSRSLDLHKKEQTSLRSILCFMLSKSKEIPRSFFETPL